MQYSPVEGKTVEHVTSEWDRLAPIRYHQIKSNVDVTFNKFLYPIINKLLGSTKSKSLLDAGCGTGILTSILAQDCSRAIGVDPSKASITIAKSQECRSVEFFASTLELFSRKGGKPFDLLVANMVLMDTLNLQSFLFAISKLMGNESVFVFSITHPVYWPRYCGYENAMWFDYNKETIIEAPFCISNDAAIHPVSTHVHRPLSQYANCVSIAGLHIEYLEEPVPAPHIQDLYPSPWLFPRYLFARCRLKQ